MTEPPAPAPQSRLELALLCGVAFAVTAMLCLTAILLGQADALARWGLLAIPALSVAGWFAWCEVWGDGAD